MLRLSLILLIGLFSLHNAAELPTLSLSKGRALIQGSRFLDTQEDPKQTLQDYSFDSNRTVNAALKVNLGDAFLTAKDLPLNTTTSMMVFLFTNVSGFCATCNDFVKYNCDKKYCKTVSKISYNMESPYYSVKKGTAVNHTIKIGDDWQLKTPAILYNYEDRTSRSVSSGYPYLTENDTYGFIGLGVAGDAVNNFNTGESQIFSIKINSTGEGAIIFGKNESLYNNTIPAQTTTCDGNWTMKGVSMSLGTDDTVKYKASVIFDLQHPGIAIPLEAFNAEGGVWKKFMDKYNISIDHSDPTDGYTYVYKGNFSLLQPFAIALENGNNLSVPASGYAEKIGNSKYRILVTPVENTANFSTAKGTTDYIVLGRSVLSQFYAVFENTKGQPSITLHPTFTGPPVDPVVPPGTNYTVYIIIGAFIVALLIIKLGAVFLKPEKDQNRETSYKAASDERDIMDKISQVSGTQL